MSFTLHFYSNVIALTLQDRENKCSTNSESLLNVK